MKSTDVPAASETMFADLHMPMLYPATVQEVHQRAGEQDQVRDDPEQMRAVFLPEENDGHEGECEKDPAPRRIPTASGWMIVLGRAHRSLPLLNGTPRAMQGGWRCQRFSRC